VIESHANNKAFLFDGDTEVLGQFVDTSMEADIKAAILNLSLPSPLRMKMLKIAELGKFRPCTTTALDLICSRNETVGVKVAAVKLIAALNDSSALERLREVALGLPELPEQLTSAFIESLAQNHMDVFAGWTLLSRSYITNRPVGGRLDLSFTLRYRLPEGWRSPFLGWILQYVREQPPQVLHEQVANGCARIDLMLLILPALLLAVLDQEQLPKDVVTDVVTAMRLRNRIPSSSAYDWHELGEATEGHPALRQQLFWDFVARQRQHGLEGLGRVWHLLPGCEGGRDPAIEDLTHDVKGLARILGGQQEHVAPFELVAEDLIWLTTSRPTVGEVNEMLTESMAAELTKALAAELKRRIEANKSRKSRRNAFLRRGRARAVRQHRRPPRIQQLFPGNVLVQLLQWTTGLVEMIDAHCFLYWHLLRVTNKRYRHQTLNAQEFLRGGILYNRLWHRLANVYWDRVSLRLVPAKSAAARHWRRFVPPLPRQSRTRSAPTVEAMIAAAGIQAAFGEGILQPTSCTADDVHGMTQCAISTPLWEFPPWFARLAALRADDVDTALAECVALEWEWSTEPSDILEKLRDFEIGPKTQAAIITKLSEPACRSLASSTLAADILLAQNTPQIEALRELARNRTEAAAEGASFRGFWFSVWLWADVDGALESWYKRLCYEVNAVELLTVACSELADQARWNGKNKQQPWSPSQVRRLILLTYRGIHDSDNSTTKAETKCDTNWRQTKALEFRAALWEILAQDTNEEATEALEALISDPMFRSMKEYLFGLRNEQLSRRVDSRRWRPQDIRAFEETYEIDPCDEYALFQIGLRRLTDIKNDVERSDTGLRTQLREGDDERYLRIWLGNELMRRAHQRYVVSQEGVIDQEQRPDLRLENPKAGSVCIEVKWAHAWSPAELLEGLELQLVGKYLRAHSSRCGIYVVAIAGQRRWKAPNDHRDLNFDELIEILQTRAQDILVHDRSLAKQIAIIGIDFRDPSVINPRFGGETDLGRVLTKRTL
jgi:hypothetical protein